MLNDYTCKVLLLAIDTSAAASAALLHEGSVRAEFTTESTRSHAEELASGIAGMLAGQRPDAVVVGIGPGPFTGLRAGIATARTLCFAWQLQLHGVISLDALAWAVVTGPRAARPDDDFLVATDARRREVYWGRYNATGQLLSGPRVGPAGQMPSELPVYGAGAGRYSQELHGRVVAGFAQAKPTAAALGQLAAVRLERGDELLESTPLYLREPDATVPGPRKRAL